VANAAFVRRFSRKLIEGVIALAEKEKKVKNSENAVQRYFRETMGELRKVNWPTWPEARRLTGLVLLVMLVVGIFLAGIDYLSGALINLVLGI
jgi:preprotein translocase subunit SecE